MPLSLEDQAKRIQGAQALGGFSNVESLAEELAERQSRVKLKRLRSLWRGEKAAIGSELAEIAQACDLDPAFFELDLQHLAGTTPSDELASELRMLRELVHDQGLRLSALELASRARSGEEDQPGRRAQ